MTGVANRRQLDAELERICAPETANSAVTVGMIDVDHFKAYNDFYGHVAGDEVLRRIAEAIRSVFRSTDTVARFRGEEFVFVLPDGADPAAMLQRMATAIRDLRVVHAASPHGRITVSCGCVTFRATEKSTPADLLAACDEAVYEAKAGGRDRCIARGA